MTEKESLKEKILEASGLQQGTPSSPDQVEELERLFRSVLGELKTGRAEVRLTKEQGEKLVAEMKSYCEKVLPQQLVKAIDQAAEQGVRDSLRPLDQGVGRTVRTLDDCHKMLGDLTWYWLRDVAVVGISMGLVVVVLMRFVFMRDLFEEGKRYEMWGRKVEQRIEVLPLKEREKFYRWAGGPP